MPASSPDPAADAGRSLSRPAPTKAVRAALALIAFLILYRLYLIGTAFQEFLPALGAVSSVGGSAGGAPDLQSLRLPAWPQVPGGLGSPVFALMLLPVMIGARAFLRRGYRFASHIVLGFLAVRAVLIVVNGPWNEHASLLMLLMASIGILLLLPGSSRWFEACDRWRAARA